MRMNIRERRTLEIKEAAKRIDKIIKRKLDIEVTKIRRKEIFRGTYFPSTSIRAEIKSRLMI